MSKSKNSKYHNNYRDRDYEDGDETYNFRANKDRFKERRIDRALRTKNIQDLMELDDDLYEADWNNEETDANIRISR